jgi:hypothetical protein
MLAKTEEKNNSTGKHDVHRDTASPAASYTCHMVVDTPSDFRHRIEVVILLSPCQFDDLRF